MELLGRGDYNRMRAYGRRKGSSHSETLRVVAVKNKPSVAPPLGELIIKLQNDSKGVDGLKSAVITNAKVLASYNWADTSPKSLVIPGLPPKWVQLTGKTQLEEDAGTFYRHVSASNYPKASMEPTVRAVLAINPTLDTQAVDLFACSKTLKNLLKFLRSNDKEFRFLLKAVGRTVFLEHRENSPFEQWLGPDGGPPRGYGHTFPKHTVKWPQDMQDSTSHLRVISYTFAGLDMVVRVEPDGYLEQGEEIPSAEKGGITELDLSALEAGLFSLEADPTIAVTSGGKSIPQSTVFQLATRSMKKKEDLETIVDEYVERCWVSRIPYFILAFHNRGVFSPSNILIENLGVKAADWQANHSQLLGSLALLLEKLLKLARDSTGFTLEAVYHGHGPLEVRYAEGEVASILPEELARYWGNLDDSSSDSSDPDSKSEKGSYGTRSAFSASQAGSDSEEGTYKTRSALSASQAGSVASDDSDRYSGEEGSDDVYRSVTPETER